MPQSSKDTFQENTQILAHLPTPIYNVHKIKVKTMEMCNVEDW